LNAIERLHEEFKRRINTQTVPPNAETAAMLFRALLASPCAKSMAGKALQKSHPVKLLTAPHDAVNLMIRSLGSFATRIATAPLGSNSLAAKQ
jgi:hypothetical protein